ncbi:hypothetical protein [Patulibacter minatonensis]|uniref:hypothetical protein n=1 Tax=Patulibacter minatonensis TaxID=298163 RepID=UPI00047AE5E5|nr:hypothetical protein [Patulibacter minatonensis]
MRTGLVHRSLAVGAAVSVLGLAACGGGGGSGTTTGAVPPGSSARVGDSGDAAKPRDSRDAAKAKAKATRSRQAAERRPTRAEARRAARVEARRARAARAREKRRAKRTEARQARAERAKLRRETAAALGTPERAVSTYLTAFGAGDGAAVCRTYTKAQQRRIARSFGTTCAKGIRQAFETGGGTEGYEQGLGSLRVGEAQVSGSRAVVQLVPLAGGDADPSLAVKLVRTGRIWLIARPSGG